jgi:hypothetical protein
MIPDGIERLALLGWRMHPAVNAPGSRAACFPDATDASTHDLDTLAGWARKYPGCNWRVVMEGSGIWALDLDVHPGEANGIEAMQRLVKQYGPLPPRPTIRSGGGGLVIFFRHNGEPIIGKGGVPAPGIDPRRGRLSVTLPPSYHHRTRWPYKWLVAPWDISPPDAPQWLLDAVKPPPEPPAPAFDRQPDGKSETRILDWAISRVQTAPSGAGNSTLNGQAFFVGRYIAQGIISSQSAYAALMTAARARKIPAHEARATIQSGFRAAGRGAHV